MMDALSHFLFQPRYELSYFGLFGALSVGYWTRYFVERWFPRKRPGATP